jgi:phosphate transport system protein
MADRAFASIYARDADAARAVIADDDRVDAADVAIEKDAVALMSDIARDACPLPDSSLRSLLTVVKVNNELERVADAASAIAARVVNLSDRHTPLPRTTVVLTNSVVGIIDQTVRAFADKDPARARQALASEGTVLSFKDVLLRDTEHRVADGRMSVDLAFDLLDIVSHAVLIADHCTNIAEQVIYESTGSIVRHAEGAWKDVAVEAHRAT